MRERLASILIAGLFFVTIFLPAASAFEELPLQAATDALSSDGRATLDHVFWRSGFGASVLGGPTFAGDTAAYNARASEIENLTNGTTPTGAFPIFVEFSSVPSPEYTSGAGNDSDYATQRWNLTNASRTTGAWSLGAGAAADAAWGAYLLRTNHNWSGSPSPNGTHIGASDADGTLGLWLVQSLEDRVNATRLFAAWNGSALGAFNFSDPALNDADAANGWQAVPDGLTVLLSSDPVPLFQGFDALQNRSTLRGQAGLILGLAETMELSDPAGAHAALFDGAPFDATLYQNSRELLLTVVMNAQAYHWNTTASAYAEPDLAAVDVGDLALYVRALAVAEHAADAALKANLTAIRESSQRSLAALSSSSGAFPASYTLSGPTVVPDSSTASLWSQSASIEAFAAVFALTGLKSDFDWMMRASAGLESRLFFNGSYRVQAPAPENSTYGATAVASTFGALSDLARTLEEPLAIYRFVDAYDALVVAPPLLLAGAQTPPVVGSSFTWNSTSAAYTGAADFDSADGLFAAYELLSVGPEFYAEAGGGVSITERAALLLHNATAAQVGAAIDSLDVQIAALNAQVAALQAAFDALNASVSDVLDRLNLSLENESISQARIAELQANLTALRQSLDNATNGTQLAVEQLSEYWQRYNDTRDLYLSVQANWSLSQQNESQLKGEVNVTKGELQDKWTALNTTEAELQNRINESAAAQRIAGLGIVVGAIVGIVLGVFVARFVLGPRVPKTKAEEEEDMREKKDDEDEGEDDDQ